MSFLFNKLSASNILSVPVLWFFDVRIAFPPLFFISLTISISSVATTTSPILALSARLNT